MITNTFRANQLYTAYCAAVGGVAFNGDPLPSWEAFEADPAKAKQVAGWIAASNVPQNSTLTDEDKITAILTPKLEAIIGTGNAFTRSVRVELSRKENGNALEVSTFCYLNFLRAPTFDGLLTLIAGFDMKKAERDEINKKIEGLQAELAKLQPKEVA